MDGIPDVLEKRDGMIYWTLFTHRDWAFILAATEKGLCFTGSENQDEKELMQWVEKRRKGMKLEQNDEYLSPYAEAFRAYLDGKREIVIPIDIEGTEFQQQVWQALQEIPYGELRCYGDIAKAIQKPKAVRAVGAAIGANPVMVVIPCHRVIGKNGSLTGFRGGLSMKKRLLQLEEQPR